jgi:hypothetical protein
MPPGVILPDSGFSPEVIARLVRMTGGNLRLLTRLLTQVERVLGVSDAQVISVEIVEAASSSARPETWHPPTNNSSRYSSGLCFFPRAICRSSCSRLSHLNWHNLSRALQRWRGNPFDPEMPRGIELHF